jgi:hypothetical protein
MATQPIDQAQGFMDAHRLLRRPHDRDIEAHYEPRLCARADARGDASQRAATRALRSSSTDGVATSPSARSSASCFESARAGPRLAQLWRLNDEQFPEPRMHPSDAGLPVLPSTQRRLR